MGDGSSNSVTRNVCVFVFVLKERQRRGEGGEEGKGEERRGEQGKIR